MVSTEPSTKPTSSTLRGMPYSSSSWSVASSVASFATKPHSGGMPAIDAAAMVASAATSGSLRPRPESSRISRVPDVWSIAPTIMNSAALNSECAKTSASPASVASREPMPITAVMNPSCETVP